MGVREDGQWSAFEVAEIVARQNGKGSIIEARELAGLFLLGERLLLHSAHEFKTAVEAFLRIWSLIEQTDDLYRLVNRKLQNNNDMLIELRSGQRLKFLARSTGSGRGFSGDLVVLDEAYNLSSAAVSALLPTMAARPNPQLWYTSSAPLDRPESDVLRRLCKRGRSGQSSRLAYTEYSADPEADHADREAWRQANPGSPIRITEEFIEGEREAMEPVDFGRERLSIFFDIDDVAEEWVLPKEDWSACENAADGLRDETLAFALDVAPNRESAAFAVSGVSGAGGLYVEVVEHHPDTGWVVAAAKRLTEKWHGVLAIAESSPAQSFKADIEKAGVNVTLVSVEEHAKACGDLLEAVKDHRLVHIGQPELTRAVAGASTREYRDGEWLWSRKSSDVDISPLVAAGLAAFMSEFDGVESVYESKEPVTL